MRTERIPRQARPQPPARHCRGERIPAGLACILLLAVALPACSCGDPKETEDRGDVTLIMAGTTVTLELALTDTARTRGLMYRKELEENSGMLFVYDSPQILSFWMKNTWIPLSIAFLRDDGTIINIEKMRPHLISVSYKSREFCRHALEMNAGWFEEHGLGSGDRIDLTPLFSALNDRSPGGDKEGG